MRNLSKLIALTGLLTGLLITTSALAAPPKIVVLNFELNDLTLTPNRPEEIARTASLAALLAEELSSQADGALTVVDNDTDAQIAADKSFGYIYDHPNVAAELGKAAGADWVLVGRMHKPTDLFQYLKVYLVDVANARLADEIIVEIKGPSEKVTQRGARRLAAKIIKSLAGQT